MAIFIQDPGSTGGAYLLESLLDASKGAVRGGGAFAWATSAGAKLVLEDETFASFVHANPFDLVIGVDAVTDAAALRTLIGLTGRLPGLSTRVFCHERTGSLFHPKFCWFREEGGGSLLVGSGNLTVGGLRGNWEAFSVITVGQKEIDEIEAQWVAWTAQHSALLLPPDDPRALERAERNIGWEGAAGPRPRIVPRTAAQASEAEIGAPAAVSPVLVAEIPRAGTRWSQANFDLKNYEEFFGAKVGTHRRVLLQNVRLDGSRGAVESRPSVEVKSQNYRFELEAAADLAYPDDGRPIGVFVQSPAGVFLYCLLMPGDPGYETVSAFLAAHWTGRPHRMRRVPTDAETLRAAWPEAPLWAGD